MLGHRGRELGLLLFRDLGDGRCHIPRAFPFAAGESETGEVRPECPVVEREPQLRAPIPALIQ
jgi:hypothetical protein